MNETQHMGQADTGEQIHESSAHSSHNSASSLIVVGTETAVFDRASRVRERILSYGRFFEEVTIVVLCSGSFKQETIKNVTLIPTNSKSRITRLLHGIALRNILPDADIVTVQDPFETGIVGWLIARKKHAALHVQVHTDFLSPEFAKLSFVNRVRVWIAGFVLRRAARIRVVSERIKKSIEQKYRLNVPISVLPIFVDVQAIKQTQRTSSNDEFLKNYQYKLLVVARNAREKNIPRAVSAFKEVAPKNACLTIFYSGSHPESFDKFGDDRIKPMNGMNAAQHYKNYDLVLVPSKYEGYGLVIVEALAAGKPVLSTDVGVAREAGAIITSEKDFARDLAKWFENGPREGHLSSYPYNNFDEYVRAYCDDIAACTKQKKSI